MSDILLNSDALNTAAAELNCTAADGKKLHDSVEALLDELAAGFDTPAGRALLQATRSQILQPLSDQNAMLTHIATALTEAKASYEPVFEEYKALNRSIGNSV